MDEMEIIAFTKGATRRLEKPHSLKKHQSHSNQMNLKKYQGHQGLLMIQVGVNKNLKKHQRQLKSQEKKLKRSHSLKKHQSHLNLLTQAKMKKRMTKTKNTSFTWAEGRSPKFFASWKDSQNLTIEKKVKKVVFMRGLYEGYELSRVALYDTKYLRGVLKMSGLGKKTKDLIKKHWQRPNSF